jgi:N-acetyltransferase
MMRTYARNVRRAWDGQDYPVAKRICVEKPKVPDENADHNLERAIRESSVAISSSPSRKNSTIFSGESHDDDTVTPPSSPPPRLSPPAVKPRKPTFSFLKRKRESTREESEPLAEVINSSSRASVPPKKQQTFVQMQLDLGGETRKTCGACGMEYVPSNEEDDTLHRMYHNMNDDGVELGKTFMKSAMKWVYEVAHIEGSVVVVDRKISPPAKKVVQKVLGVVNKELSATGIEDDVLWSQKLLNEGAGNTVQGVVKQSDAEKRNDNKSDRYKIFLHVKNGKCVGLCLAERVTKAHRVKDNNKVEGGGQDLSRDHKSSSVSIEDETVPAVVGVSRIWTSKSSRRKGIANNLLDCVLNQFIYGMEIDKDELAFSQPTESGGELAKAWYGEESGWLVYKED